MKKLFFLLVSMVVFPAAVIFAAGVPKQQGWVNDFAGIISIQDKEKLTSLIEEVEQKTSAEIAVVIVESIAPYDEKEYSRLLFDNWKIGKKDKNNGVLVLVAVKEKLWRIDIGYGLEGDLSDSFCGRVGREYMVPYFKNGQFGKGLYYGVAAITKEITRDSGISIKGIKGIKFKGEPESLVFAFFCFLFFVIWNLPWPVFIGLPFTLLFAIALYSTSPLTGILIIAAYITSMLIRYNYWLRLPRDDKLDLTNTLLYGLRGGSGCRGGGFSGGSFGGFGGGVSGGAGAGGRF